MNGVEVGEFLLFLSLVFALIYVLGYFLSKFRIPSILAALFVGIVLSYIPFFPFIHSIWYFCIYTNFLVFLPMDANRYKKMGAEKSKCIDDILTYYTLQIWRVLRICRDWNGCGSYCSRSCYATPI